MEKNCETCKYENEPNDLCDGCNDSHENWQPITHNERRCADCIHEEKTMDDEPCITCTWCYSSNSLSDKWQPKPTISKTEPKDIENAAKEYLDKYFLGSIMSRREAIKLMSDFAAIRAVELLKWAQKNATYSRRLTVYGYRLKSTPFSVYELLSEEELYAKFSADAGGKEDAK